MCFFFSFLFVFLSFFFFFLDDDIDFVDSVSCIQWIVRLNRSIDFAAGLCFMQPGGDITLVSLVIHANFGFFVLSFTTTVAKLL